MRKRGLRYMWTSLLVLMLAGRAVAEDPRVSVRICNFSSAEPEILFRAGATAQRIFQDAGIRTEWITASDPRKLDPSTLTVQIFPGRSKRDDAKDAFGVAIFAKGTTPYLADVFFGTIEDAAATRKEQALFLGHVMAHEVGHLLLGTDHMPGTVMAPGLGSQDLPVMEAGRVRFSPRQSERLRTAVVARQSVSAARSRLLVGGLEDQ